MISPDINKNYPIKNHSLTAFPTKTGSIKVPQQTPIYAPKKIKQTEIGTIEKRGTKI